MMISDESLVVEFSHFLSALRERGVLPVMWCLEALPRLEAASRPNFHCLGLGLGLDP